MITALPTSTGGGNMIVIGHGAALETVYQHLASRQVSVGDRVSAGQPIGVEGTTGNSTGPHLHFTVKINGAPTDPRPWFADQGITLPAPGGSGTAPPPVTLPPTTGATAAASATLLPLAPTPPAGATKPLIAQLPARVGAYTGEQILNAGYIIKAGQAMSLPAKAITIGVMTAMGESGLINVDHGDQAGPDSRGLFQQRDNGTWGNYTDRMNPTTSATNFFRALTAVPGYLSLEPTIAAHQTQHNADPYHYTRYWAPAVEMVSVLTADPALLTRLPASGPIDGCQNPTDPPPAGDGTGAAIVAAAKHYLGAPYSWGGGTIDGPSLGIHATGSLDGTHTVGFDCSGLVLFAVYNATGIRLAHDAESQGHDPQGQPMSRDWSMMRPGDVIAFSTSATGVPGTFSHVGIYTGEGTMIHAARPGEPVQTVQLRDSSYYERMTWSIRRYARA